MFVLRRWICSTIAALALITAVHATGDVPGNAAHAAILVHMDCGKVLYEKNADERLLIASTTKIMTALVTLENAALSEQVIATRAHCSVEGSSVYLRPGEAYTVEMLLYGMMLSSGNDAALALAEHVCGSEEAFVDLMNEYASELGLRNTHFSNSHGLDADDHYSSAADLAKLTCAAMKNETFVQIASTREYGFDSRFLVNHNKLLWRFEGCKGVKTGYTKAAGRCLVSFAERDGLRLVCVTLSDPQDWTDHEALLAWGFQNWQYRKLSLDGIVTTVPVISGEKETVRVACAQAADFLVPARSVIRTELDLPPFVYADIEALSHAGYMRLYAGDKELACVELVFADSVALAETMRLTALEQIRRGLELSERYGGVWQYGIVYAPSGGGNGE